MTIFTPLAGSGRATMLTTTRRCVRAVLRRPSLLALMVLYVFAASCATSPGGFLAGLAIVGVFCVRTVCIVRAELGLTG
jgi:hypothetical protein